MGGLTEDQLRSSLGFLPALLMLWVQGDNVLLAHRSGTWHYTVAKETAWKSQGRGLMDQT